MKTLPALVAALALAAPLAHAGAIVVGQVAAMTGPEASQGRAYAAGMELLFNSVNAAGGVNGHTFSLVRKDDGGRAEDTVPATRQLLANDKPMVLAGYIGSRNVGELLASGLLEKDRIALVGYRSAEIRPDKPWVYSVRAGLRDELNKIAEHLATIGIDRLGLFYEEGPGAAALLAAADEAAARARTQIVARGSYPAGGAAVGQAVDLFLHKPPQAILMVSSGAATAAFIEEFRANGGSSQLFAHSGADVEQMSKRLGEEQMQGVAIAQVTPSPYRITNRLSREFSDLAGRTPDLGMPASYSMMEGFITAKVIVEAVRRQGARPTREGMAATLDGMERLDLGGYLVGFRPGMRTGSRFVELSIISGAGKLRQ